MKRTKIVATIGPASEKEEVLEKLIKAGINVMRLNFSHGSYEEHLEKVLTLRKLNEKNNTAVAFLLDTKGPEIRLGTFADDKKHQLVKGTKFTLTTDQIEGDDTRLTVNYKDLVKDAKVGGTILLDDGLIGLTIDKIEGSNIECTVQNNGMLGGKKGVNVPNVKLSLKAMTEKDKEDLKFAVKHDFDYVAASFVRKASDVIEMKEFLKSIGDNSIKIISKIENQEGLDNFDEILEVSDGIMVARGDLGVEINIEDLPTVQKNMIKKTVHANKLVITATQMLESMQKNPRPTRAEVSDVANAVYDGTSCVMLSGESALGDYPVECVEVMSKIVNAAEANLDYWKRFRKRNIERLAIEHSVDATDEFEYKKQVSFALCCSAMYSNAKAIISVTEHGNTPSILSSYRPGCPIYVFTANAHTYRQMSAEQNVTAIYIENEYNYENMLKKGIAILKERKLLKTDDTVIISSNVIKNDKNEEFVSTGSIVKI